jgi:NADH-quinone oxidoreductase subunit D
VLRLVLTLDGETVTEVRPVIGYLHTGIEKNMEFRTWTQGVTFCTRMDYLAPFFNEAAYCLAVERLLRIEDAVRGGGVTAGRAGLPRGQRRRHAPLPGALP